MTRQLLLGYLADRRHGDSTLSRTAVEFMLCQAFAGEIVQLQKAGASAEEEAGLLVSYRSQLSALQRPAASPLAEGLLSGALPGVASFSRSDVLLGMCCCLDKTAVSLHAQPLALYRFAGYDSLTSRSLNKGGKTRDWSPVFVTQPMQVYSRLLLGCAEEALKLARAATQAALSGRGRLQIIRRIAEATNAARQAPTMRARAIRALSGVVKADTGLLALPEIQHSIDGALKVCNHEHGIAL